MKQSKDKAWPKRYYFLQSVIMFIFCSSFASNTDRPIRWKYSRNTVHSSTLNCSPFTNCMAISYSCPVVLLSLLLLLLLLGVMPMATNTSLHWARNLSVLLSPTSVLFCVDDVDEDDEYRAVQASDNLANKYRNKWVL